MYIGKKPTAIVVDILVTTSYLGNKEKVGRYAEQLLDTDKVVKFKKRTDRQTIFNILNYNYDEPSKKMFEKNTTNNI